MSREGCAEFDLLQAWLVKVTRWGCRRMQPSSVARARILHLGQCPRMVGLQRLMMCLRSADYSGGHSEDELQLDVGAEAVSSGLEKELVHGLPRVILCPVTMPEGQEGLFLSDKYL